MHHYFMLAGRFLLTSSLAVAIFACDPAPEETRVPFYATPTPVPTPVPTPAPTPFPTPTSAPTPTPTPF